MHFKGLATIVWVIILRYINVLEIIITLIMTLIMRYDWRRLDVAWKLTLYSCLLRIPICAYFILASLRLFHICHWNVIYLVYCRRWSVWFILAFADLVFVLNCGIFEFSLGCFFIWMFSAQPFFENIMQLNFVVICLLAIWLSWPFHAQTWIRSFNLYILYHLWLILRHRQNRRFVLNLSCLHMLISLRTRLSHLLALQILINFCIAILFYLHLIIICNIYICVWNVIFFIFF